ncbi:MAG: DUF86 domain-containing protein [Pseudanabaena sp.]|jgi:uncharacterized protein with HEPN domain|nr:DUF86 domain-containing protein [Pseudanabaena sp. M090S1SP2A07QC]MCA6522339.1 DUF86 domain-containing protein [Pseudanabaena sp. M051S1SP2A07QC]MCA6532480.1 DUF86 domain-containing protein [Pseudanabaena sp. M125S2SP2A07QC]MCA6536941.1 DUF86 domain-containing protein [Pseudanabaena sp. M176S2SP2A07QC]MCA6538511.1 DUF86 domain-containing protein [Pseudanabaena sp. M037S2SP2A07QC]MCA6549357.1 DUF86 domain-containing protein [Pseudanabaena sp. M152S2SP2A07QC]MCA6554388.1 DUF86 domain-contain
MNLERDKVYMEHILECIDKINNYTGKDRARFMGNEFVQDAVLRRLQIMAESTQRLSDDLKATALDIDWRALSGFRNILVHDYLDGIDLYRVWDAIENNLPDLQREIASIYSQVLSEQGG